MKLLRAKLYEVEMAERESKVKEMAGEKKEIAWGSQQAQAKFATSQHPVLLKEKTSAGQLKT